MILRDENDGSTTILVRVIPRSSKAEIVGEYDGSLKIKLNSPPVDGAANEELVRFLSKLLDTPRSNIEIISGQTARTKRVRIIGLSMLEINRFLQAKS